MKGNILFKEFFKVIDCFSSAELETTVNHYLNSGWVLLEIREQHSEFFHVYSVHFGRKGFLFKAESELFELRSHGKRRK